ncbi:MAG: hypothetical protein HFJ51_01075 [Clostridia bacterium]|nr:hypothetical protein [Clostridia bacterium]
MISYLITFLVSMIPIIELRGAIPIGVGMGLSYFEAFTISFIRKYNTSIFHSKVYKTNI